MDFQLSDAQKGEGVPQDYAEAVKWYRKAAEQGLPAVRLLGIAGNSLGRLAPRSI